MLAVRFHSVYEQSHFLITFNACAPQLTTVGTPEAAMSELLQALKEADKFDMSAATTFDILEHRSVYCCSIGSHSELLEVADHRGTAAMAAFATAFISRLI